MLRNHSIVLLIVTSFAFLFPSAPGFFLRLIQRVMNTGDIFLVTGYLYLYD
jgi:hypothetical protein